MNSQRKIILGLFTLVVLVSTGLRLYQLNTGLWLDEITTYVKYARLPFSQIATSFESENQHFLYSLMAHASFLLFGESNWALRLPAVIFGIGSIIALFVIGLQVTNDLEALLATSLMAFSYHHLWFSQNGRGYTGMLFWTLLSSWFLLRALREKKTRLWILFGLSAALGVYTHLTMLFVIAGQFIVAGAAFLFRPGNRQRNLLFQILLGFGLAGLLSLLLHAPVLGEMRSVIGGSQVSLVSEWKSPLWTAREILLGLEVGFSGVIAAGLVMILFTIGLISYWRSYPEVVGLFIIPPVIGAGFTIAIGHHLWPRFFFFAFGFGALILIRGLLVSAKWFSVRLHIPKSKQVWVGTILALSLIIVSALSMRYAYGPKQDYDGALSYVESQLIPGDQIVTISIASSVYNDFYKTGWVTLTSLDQLNELRSKSGRIWLIYTFPEVMSAVYPDIAEIINNEFVLANEFPGTVRSGTIFVYLEDLQPGTSGKVPVNRDRGYRQ